MKLPDPVSLAPKLKRLEDDLRRAGSLLVAFSGGVDSTFLLAAARDVLGRDRVLAVNAVSSTYPAAEQQRARNLARKLDVRLRVIHSEELDVPGFSENRPDRCYHCKKELFSRLKEIAAAERLAKVADGANADDPGEHRPGLKAAAELGVVSPLKAADLHKDEIRSLSKARDLETWDRPAMACLASRFPYGEEITAGKLSRVDRAESALRQLGFDGLRVRSHGDVARLELAPADIPRAAGPQRERVAAILREAGFAYAALDLEGYRAGSLNEVL